MTQWAREVSPANALPEYPRPQLVRDTWQNLNGLWDYAITDKQVEKAPAAYEGRILVPYPIESALSGVMKPLLPTQRLWFHRRFTIPDSWAGQRVLLQFGAVDWETQVVLNGKDLGGHRGGYDAFFFDITDALRPGENDLVIRADDPTSSSWQLRGKQTLHPGGAAYTASSGIWQTVWLEPVPASHIETLHIVTDGIAGILHLTVGARITPQPAPVTVTVSDGMKTVATAEGMLGSQLTPAVLADLKWYKATSSGASATLAIPIPNAHLWTPEDPFLYNLTITIHAVDGKGDDVVHSYAGLRSLSVGKDAKGNTRLFLNGKVTMLPMVLDQGFWPDGIYTAPTDAALRFDLDAEKELGVAVRKHVKMEPDRWYYWADKLGVLVLQDMPTGEEGNAATDRPTSPEAAAQCEMEMRALIAQRWNHPAIISWNMFNEGWGQHDTVATAAWARALDPTRLIDEASGFPWQGAGDICDCHGGVPPKSDTEISIDTENGSVGLKSPGHDWPGRLWTPLTYDAATDGPASPRRNGLYTLDASSKAWFTRWVRAMFHSLWANMDQTGQTGDSYCQITDVETEEDGLISYDRTVWKVDPDPIRLAAQGQSMRSNTTTILPTAMTQSSVWNYTTSKPGEGWNKPGFDDSGWKKGASAFGAGYDHIGTPWTSGDIWLRKEITLTSIPAKPFLRIIHDEDFQVYFNGVEASHEGGYISSYDDYDMTPASIAVLKPGRNLMAVHCHQTVGGQVIDVGLLDARQ